ncbi:MAG: YHS domain-containing protein [Clostridia bacterium]|nr:YHS domain-containing protein [Clostridia bacterium]
MVRCPVCGMAMDEATAAELGAEVVEHAGETLYFCGRYCRDAFVKEPARYLARRGDGAGAEAGEDPS